MDETLKQIMKHIIEMEMELYNITILKNNLEEQGTEKDKIILELQEKINQYSSLVS